MEANKILSASLLDLVFDDRNKSYGAYELRRTYPERVKKSLLFTFGLALTIFMGTLLANSMRPSDKEKVAIREVELEAVKEDELEPPKPIEPPKRIEPQPIRTEQLSTMVIKRDEDVEEPPPTQEDLENAKIDVIKTEGVEDVGIVAVEGVDDGKGIIEQKKEDEIVPFTSVQVHAKFNGDWTKFLLRNLNGNVPVDNGAPVGKYRIMIEFVVDTDGSVSNITPLTSMGYGMEQEAVRVLKKAAKWQPAIQNGRQVKAYHKQVIVFEVEEP
jgi:periplasmic protein TonB